MSDETFSIWLQAVSPIAAGSAATVEAVLVAKPPYHCNADYPHKFKLAAAPAGLTYPETTVKGAKVTAEKSVLPIPVQAQSPGKAKVSGTLSFSVCNDERCLIEKRDLDRSLCFQQPRAPVIEGDRQGVRPERRGSEGLPEFLG